MLRRVLLTIAISAVYIMPASAIEKPGVVNKVIQFAADKIPRIDRNADEWTIVGG
jgi:hypothetical protein